jgi:hypothetical protein
MEQCRAIFDTELPSDIEIPLIEDRELWSRFLAGRQLGIGSTACVYRALDVKSRLAPF